jgi:predicted TIM-barrel fold metal-dependent hydrolase
MTTERAPMAGKEPSQPITDSDRHVIEPIDLWREYLPQSLKDRAPRQQGEELVFEGRSPFGYVSPVARQIVMSQALDRLSDLAAASHPRGQLGAMDRQGVAIAHLYPTYALYLAYVDGADPVLSGAIAQAYNAWLFDYCRFAPDRLKGVGLICRHRPDLMLAELERVIGYGWRAVVLRPNPIEGRNLADPAYRPFWAACEANSVAVTFHEGTQSSAPTAGAERFRTRFAQLACSHPMEQMMAFLALLEGGVFARHPALRVGFLEAGAGWLPAWLWRLDNICWESMRKEMEGLVDLPPSHYFRRQCWISFEAGEPGLELVIQAIGVDRLVFGSDYPHLDHGSDPIALQLSRSGTVSGETLLRTAFSSNPARLFGDAGQQMVNG